jgi:hypothetical protein
MITSPRTLLLFCSGGENTVDRENSSNLNNSAGEGDDTTNIAAGGTTLPADQVPGTSPGRMYQSFPVSMPLPPRATVTTSSLTRPMGGSRAKARNHSPDDDGLNSAISKIVPSMERVVDRSRTKDEGCSSTRDES